jgi:8-hydroxy-5-deazaflavin:NADPH oxidoreductase
MTTISIIGTGNMGRAIGAIAEAGRHQVQYVGRKATDLTGDIVVFAVPYPAVAELIETYRDQLAGKIVVDITNPLDFNTFDGLTVPAGSSAAEVIAAALPQSEVVKAFNTTFGATLAAKSIGALPTTVLIAGDSDSAKKAVADLATGGGLQVADAGALKRAHELEAIGFFQITLAAKETIGWTGGLALVR